MHGFLELQEGKERMKLKQYFRRLGTTSACVRRMLDAGVKFCTRKLVVPEDDNENGTDGEDGDLDLSLPLEDYDDIDDARRAARAQGILPQRPDLPGEQLVSLLFNFFYKTCY